ncbi:hypothetical protein F5H01DRAFT_346661 [Linnemannia elongata]|nr:hypothetical protein F5H01DRAFT_346661 [Linnemannia elongata]
MDAKERHEESKDHLFLPSFFSFLLFFFNFRDLFFFHFLFWLVLYCFHLISPQIHKKSAHQLFHIIHLQPFRDVLSPSSYLLLKTNVFLLSFFLQDDLDRGGIRVLFFFRPRPRLRILCSFMFNCLLFVLPPSLLFLHSSLSPFPHFPSSHFPSPLHPLL